MKYRIPPLFALILISVYFHSAEATITTLTVTVPGDNYASTGGTGSAMSGDLRYVLNYINLFPNAPSSGDTYDVIFQLPGGSETIMPTDFLPIINLVNTEPVTIDGSNNTGMGSNTQITIDGNSNTQRAFFAEQGTVTIQNITIQNTLASGGSATDGGGGGLGAGGALFIDKAAVSLSNVTLSSNNATGGSGIFATAPNGSGGGGMVGNGGNGIAAQAAGGGGGLGGNGGNATMGSAITSGGGGGISTNGAGGDGSSNGNSGGGYGALPAGDGYGTGSGIGGANAGGGGGAGTLVGTNSYGAGGGGSGGGSVTNSPTGGTGGFGGGGGGGGSVANPGNGGAGGFGGGDGGQLKALLVRQVPAVLVGAAAALAFQAIRIVAKEVLAVAAAGAQLLVKEVSEAVWLRTTAEAELDLAAQFL